jgi:hypothetical protein
VITARADSSLRAGGEAPKTVSFQPFSRGIIHDKLSLSEPAKPYEQCADSFQERHISFANPLRSRPRPRPRRRKTRVKIENEDDEDEDETACSMIGSRAIDEVHFVFAEDEAEFYRDGHYL